MGFCRCCCNCVCEGVKLLCQYGLQSLFGYSAVSCCCCLIGMATMALIFVLYYWLLAPKLHTAALKPGVMDYEGEPINSHEDIKRHILNSKRDYEESDAFDDMYVTEEELSEPLRDKRASSPAAGVPTSLDTQEQSSSTVGGGQTSSTAGQATTATKKPPKGHKTTPLPVINAPLEEDEPDFHMGHRVMDVVFGDAEKTDMKQSLGLCRKNAELKVPELRAALFPTSAAADILTCINDILKNTASKQICLHLDEEMNAYLRWLILTGEAKEKHEQQVSSAASKEDFLFPTACPSGVTPLPPNPGGVEPGRLAGYQRARVNNNFMFTQN